MSRTRKVTNYHVLYARRAWFLWVIMSTFARFVLLAVSEEAETWLPNFCVPCIIKQLLDSVFVISRIIKVEVRVINWSRRQRLISLTEILIIVDSTKTSSKNCQQYSKHRTYFKISEPHIKLNWNGYYKIFRWCNSYISLTVGRPLNRFHLCESNHNCLP